MFRFSKNKIPSSRSNLTSHGSMTQLDDLSYDPTAWKGNIRKVLEVRNLQFFINHPLGRFLLHVHVTFSSFGRLLPCHICLKWGVVLLSDLRFHFLRQVVDAFPLYCVYESLGHINHQSPADLLSFWHKHHTPLKSNMEPRNWWLDVFPFPMRHFQFPC